MPEPPARAPRRRWPALALHLPASRRCRTIPARWRLPALLALPARAAGDRPPARRRPRRPVPRCAPRSSSSPSAWRCSSSPTSAPRRAFRRPFNPVLDGELVPARPGACSAARSAGRPRWPPRPRSSSPSPRRRPRPGGRRVGSPRLAPARRRPWLAALALAAAAVVAADAARRPASTRRRSPRPPGWPGSICATPAPRAPTSRASAPRPRATRCAALPPDRDPAGAARHRRPRDLRRILRPLGARQPALRPDRHARRSATTEARLAAAGLAMRSGYLTAPMVGGQSWLAHASLLSGLAHRQPGPLPRARSPARAARSCTSRRPPAGRRRR